MDVDRCRPVCFRDLVVQYIVLIVILKLYCSCAGGSSTNMELMQRMVQNGSGRVVDDDFAGGSLEVSVIRASGLHAKGNPFCAVRVEGHQRNTQVSTGTQDPEWYDADSDAANFNFRVVDRHSAQAEVFIYSHNKNTTDESLGCVTFPLALIPAARDGTAFEQVFAIEPDQKMPNSSRGSLGELTIRMCFMEYDDSAPEADSGETASDLGDESEEAMEKQSRRQRRRRSRKSESVAEVEGDSTMQLTTSDAVEALIAAARDESQGGVMSAEIIQLLREAATIVIARTKARLENPISRASNTELQRLALNEDSNDEAYVLQDDLKLEETYTARRLDYKYLCAIRYCICQFLGLNPSVLNQISSTINKFEPAPEATGEFAAVCLGTLGAPIRILSSVRTYLTNQLSEEMNKLLLVAKLERDWTRELSNICRGRGCATECVNLASERIAEANSFSTAAALMRLREAEGPAEAADLRELNTLVHASGDNFIIAGVQNLELMIWPTREETFAKVRTLVGCNSGASTAIAGLEARAEMALILSSFHVPAQAMHGLVAIEAFMAKLKNTDRHLEVAALQKLLDGDKAAAATMRKLTPSIADKLRTLWKSVGRMKQLAILVAVAVVLVLVLLRVAMTILVAISLHDTPIGMLLTLIANILLAVIGSLIGTFACIIYISKGKTYRDKIKGPHPVGIELLRTIARSSDPDKKADRLACLDAMLAGHECDEEHKLFFKSRALKYQEQVPEGIQAFECMETMRVLQQAGKSTIAMTSFKIEVKFPPLTELFPPSRDSWMEALIVLKHKVKSFLFSSKMHPWMKRYCMYAGQQDELFHVVEVPLTMMPSNQEKLYGDKSDD